MFLVCLLLLATLVLCLGCYLFVCCCWQPFCRFSLPLLSSLLLLLVCDVISISAAGSVTLLLTLLLLLFYQLLLLLSQLLLLLSQLLLFVFDLSAVTGVPSVFNNPTVLLLASLLLLLARDVLGVYRGMLIMTSLHFVQGVGVPSN